MEPGLGNETAVTVLLFDRKYLRLILTAEKQPDLNEREHTMANDQTALTSSIIVVHYNELPSYK